MSVHSHLQIVGALLVLLGAAHSLFGRYFGWKKELAQLSLLTRQVFIVHCFFIGLLLILLGACSLFYADVLLEPSRLSRVVLAGMVLFWLFRLIVQLFVYDRAIWRGRSFYTLMHVGFSLFWIYVIVTYGVALGKVWGG